MGPLSLELMERASRLKVSTKHKKSLFSEIFSNFLKICIVVYKYLRNIKACIELCYLLNPVKYGSIERIS